MSNYKFTSLTPELYDYSWKIADRESEVLKNIRRENDMHPQIRMQISPDQAQFLQFLIQISNAKNVLEVGTFLGYSAAAMAEVLPKDGKVVTCDIDALTTQKAQIHWEHANLSDKIVLKLGSALETLHQLINEKQQFDFIFIDADKGNYIQYYELAKELITPKGIIAIDNIFFHGEVCHANPSKTAQHIIKFNQHVQQDSTVSISLLPIADGLLLIQKQLA